MYGGLLGTVDTIKKADATSPIPVASTGTVYTPHFNLHGADAFGVQLLAAAGGNDVDVLVQLEEGMEAPTSEAQDDDWAVPDGMADVFNLTDETVHLKQLTPVPAKYGRFKLTGQGSNNAATTVRIKLFRQEMA